VDSALCDRLVAGIVAQDEAAIADGFAREARFRALIPPGLRERTGAVEAGALIAAWFRDSTVLDLVDTEAAEVGDRLHISYRFTGVEEGEPYVVEQHLFCVVSDGKIERADLLCSGFRRPAGPR
jgi:hypothetical protein